MKKFVAGMACLFLGGAIYCSSLPLSGWFYHFLVILFSLVSGAHWQVLLRMYNGGE